MAIVEVLGVYVVPEAPEPVHLSEFVVRESPGFDPAAFVQPDPGQPEESWQTASVSTADDVVRCGGSTACE